VQPSGIINYITIIRARDWLTAELRLDPLIEHTHFHMLQQAICMPPADSPSPWRHRGTTILRDSSHYHAQVLPGPCSHSWPVYFDECIPDGAHDCVFNCANHCAIDYVDYCVYDCVLEFVDYCVGSCAPSCVHDDTAIRMVDSIMSRMIPSAR
jgi:hypothetical protein